MVGNRTMFDSQFLDFRDLIKVCFGNRRVNLKVQADLPGNFHGIDGTVKGTRYLSETVMALAGCTVYADANALDAGIYQLFCDTLGDQRSVGSHDHS